MSSGGSECGGDKKWEKKYGDTRLRRIKEAAPQASKKHISQSRRPTKYHTKAKLALV
jgi:hypothetical protein